MVVHQTAFAAVVAAAAAAVVVAAVAAAVVGPYDHSVQHRTSPPLVPAPGVRETETLQTRYPPWQVHRKVAVY